MLDKKKVLTCNMAEIGCIGISSNAKCVPILVSKSRV
jgi:hypothetical protein